jgi:hypothetical protein
MSSIRNLKKVDQMMGKLYRLINLMLIFIPLVTLAFMAGFFGMILFEFQYWKATLFND